MRQKGNKICICLWYDNIYTGIETWLNTKGCILKQYLKQMLIRPKLWLAKGAV